MDSRSRSTSHYLPLDASPSPPFSLLYPRHLWPLFQLHSPFFSERLPPSVFFRAISVASASRFALLAAVSQLLQSLPPASRISIQYFHPVYYLLYTFLWVSILIHRFSFDPVPDYPAMFYPAPNDRNTRASLPPPACVRLEKIVDRSRGILYPLYLPISFKASLFTAQYLLIPSLQGSRVLGSFFRNAEHAPTLWQSDIRPRKTYKYARARK